MKSFLIAATIALAGSSLIADTALAKSKRSAAGMGGMAGMAAMAPALAAGVGLIGSGYVGGPVITPYVGPINTYVEPVIVPHVHVPVYTPYVPSGFGLPGAPRQDIGG
jgi:hypothetical protein